MILVVTAPSDLHADRVVGLLAGRGVPVVRFDPAELPASAELTFHGRVSGTRVLVRRGGEIVDLSGVAAAWFRRPGVPEPDARLRDAATRDVVTDLTRAVVEDVWTVLPCAWLPAEPAHLAHLGKIRQYVVARALGFDVPDTLVSNSPADVLDLYRAHDGRLVTKVPGRSALTASDSPWCRYTEAVSTVDVGYVREVAYCPTIVQEYVPKHVELRVTVVGDAVFAAEIDSQGTNHTRHDWRRYDHQHTRYRAHDLPLDVAERCRALVTTLGLRYGAIDLVLTPDGRHVFLEINPNGQFLWVEDATGLPISAAIADLLVSLAGRGGA